MIRTIALDKLVPSPANVRRARDEQADLQLKADIAARGLLQNLVVTRAKRPRGAFAVEAGGRRLAALKALAEEGVLAADREVACLVLEDRADAQETSLAENFQRLAMNPADECLAFQHLLDGGADVEGIARRFGLTVRFVEGRLRLAALAPAVFAALGAGEITLDLAKAYAATPDQARQEYVFEQMARGYGGARPDSVRRMMTHATVAASDRRALFVGEDAYLAAGGRIERDLFGEDSDARWLDVEILEQLACEKLAEAAALAVAETGLGFVRPTLAGWVSYGHTEGLRRVPLETPPLSDAETAQVDALEGEIEDLVRVLEDEDADPAQHEEAEARIAILGERVEAITDKPPVVEEALKAGLGAFMILDERGRPRLDNGRYAERPDDDAAADGRAETGESPDTATRNGEATRGRAGGLARRLIDELAMQRRDILALHVAADPALARDLAAFLMIDCEPGYAFESSGSSLRAPRPSDPVSDAATPDTAAAIAWAKMTEALDRSWLEGETRTARFHAFRALSEEARAAWLGHAVAATLEATCRVPGARACAFHDHLGGLLGIDTARWWRPTGANYFDRVPKAVALAALEDVGGEELAGRHAKAKKAALAEACERIFAGDAIAEPEVKAAALAWVPEAMRFGQPVCGEREGEVDDATGEPAALGDGQVTAEASSSETAEPVAGELDEAA